MKYLLVALISTLIVSTYGQAAILIDDFSVGANLVQDTPGTITRTTTDAGLLGGTRDESLTLRDLGGSEFQATIGYNGNFVFSQGSNDEAFGSLTYDDFSSFDLTDGGANTHLALGFRTNDIDADITDVVSITAVSGANSSTQPLTIPASSSLPLDVFVDFADFTGVNFTQLDSLTMTFDTQTAAGRDFELDFFNGSNPSAVPEPFSIVFLVIGAVGLFAGRRRR